MIFRLFQILCLVIVTAVFPLFSSHAKEAEENAPVCFWRIIDESKYIYRYDWDRMNWREIRKRKALNKTANQDPKVAELRLSGPDKRIDLSMIPPEAMLRSATFLVRDPNGVIRHPVREHEESPTITIPEGEALNGRYLIGAHIPLGPRDMDGDGAPEFVHLCAKRFVLHYKNGGKVGMQSDVFFNDVEQMPLEIGPVIDTAKSKFGGGTQHPHRSYEMMVKYFNLPLPGAKVTVTAEDSRWSKEFVTDENGIFEIIPTDDRFVDREWQKYLYTAVHHDRDNNAFYAATLPVVVYKNRPEWRSRALGFIYWSIFFSGFGMITTAGYVGRRNRLNKRKLIVFDNHKIKEESS